MYRNFFGLGGESPPRSQSPASPDVRGMPEPAEGGAPQGPPLVSAAEADGAPGAAGAAAAASAVSATKQALLRALREEVPETAQLPPSMEDEEREGTREDAPAPEGMCVECGDMPAELFCEQCQDDFCAVCFGAVHRHGRRKKHVTKRIAVAAAGASPAPAAAAAAAASAGDEASSKKARVETVFGSEAASGVAAASAAAAAAPAELEGDARREMAAAAAALAAASSGPLPQGVLSASSVGDFYLERAKYIPLRLTLEERKKLRLVEAALEVSDYTDKVDIIAWSNKAQRIHAQIQDICAILSGLLVASDYRKGQELVRENDFKDNAVFFQDMFEIARRHKIRNPEKMRSAYGKLMHVLMDSVSPEIQEMLEFSCVRKVRTVYDWLAERGGLPLLRDDLVEIATGEVRPDGKPRAEVERELRRKDRAMDLLVQRYQDPVRGLTNDGIRHAVHSIGDNRNFLVFNRNSCERMLEYLQTYFHPEREEGEFSLAIRSGVGGARLSHTHALQFSYCQQSLILWREILHEFFKLWTLCEDDMLNPDNPYRLRNTGQGLNRVQSAPLVGRAMGNILARVHRRVGNWIGSSVVHLGDSNVPSALNFIDKYTQVARILNPIVITLRSLERLYKKPDLARYFDATFGGVERCRKIILCDFFRHAFDGSGADDYFSAGSCIDGRLTSAWNWCHSIEKKPFYHVFLLAGFQGFDGQF